ncbi:peptidase [Zhihengliuella somnathii]
MKKFTTGAALTAAALLAIAGAAAPSTASPDHAPGQDVKSHVVQKHEKANGYWTAEKMRHAIPGDVLAEQALERGVATPASDVARGALQQVDGVDRRNNGKGNGGGGKQTLATEETPVEHIGKVFFTLGGNNYVCSGNSVSAANGSTVSTAGHCLNEGPGAFATNFVFVPAYDDGAAPYGQWAATELHAPAAWVDNGDMTYDTGFAVVETKSGATLADTVGATGVQFNADRGLGYQAYGYPAASPFDGSDLFSCLDADSENDPYNPQFNSQGIDCDMTGGSSGGPWFIGSGHDSYQNSVNSYGYDRLDYMFGPYWGTTIYDTYSTASN